MPGGIRIESPSICSLVSPSITSPGWNRRPVPGSASQLWPLIRSSEIPRSGSQSTLSSRLLAAQPHPAAPLQVQDGEGPNLANTEMDLEQFCGAEKLTAVVTQGGGYGGLPATEVIGLQHGGQSRSLQRIMTLGLGGGTGKAEGCCRLTLRLWIPGSWNDKIQRFRRRPCIGCRGQPPKPLDAKP
jgi:hypothetical protein